MPMLFEFDSNTMTIDFRHRKVWGGLTSSQFEKGNYANEPKLVELRVTAKQ